MSPENDNHHIWILTLNVGQVANVHKNYTAKYATQCINCSVCYAACDTVTVNEDYLGPAALQRAWTLLNDAKDEGRRDILDAVSDKGGCHNCHSIGSCTTYCPNDLDPLSAIAGLKRETAKFFFKGSN